jgi:electron transfer flavoprotein alpha subunit
VQSLSALTRLLSSLAILEQRDGKLIHGSSSAVTAAQKLGGSITGFVAGSNIKSIAEQAAKIAGVEKIIAVDNAAYDKACLDPRLSRTVFAFLTSIYRDYQRTLPHSLWKI